MSEVSTSFPMATEAARPSRARRFARAIGFAVVVLVLITIVAAVAAGFWLRERAHDSLAQLDGTVRIAGLTQPVEIARDAYGVATIHGTSRVDVARALGFAHAQERFFQMDLLRRAGAGELSELYGPMLLERDRSARVHRFRSVARALMATLPNEQTSLIRAYADGVNAGLRSLAAPPVEYAALRTEPRAWSPEDSLLCGFAMFFRLHLGERYETSMGVLHDKLPRSLFDFLTPLGTEWDAPIEGRALTPPPIPSADVLDLRGRLRAVAARPLEQVPVPGSSAWAIAGTHTKSGRAILANDMHLPLGLPSTWYRVSLRWSDHVVTGMTVPGIPMVLAGSNGRIAWGFTNSQIDTSDLIVLETRGESYRTVAGWKPFVRHREIVRVKGKPDEIVDVRVTEWGPVVDRDHAGRSRAVRWTADLPGGLDFHSLHLETATNIDDAIAIAHASGMPPLNFLVADDRGRIGWTIIGRVPRRVGFDGRVPQSWSDGRNRWDGFATDVPRVVDPPSGRIWSGNARMVGGAGLATLGDGGYLLGARAQQIRDGLFAIEKATEADMLRVQLDDRAIYLSRWRDLLLATIGRNAEYAELRKHVENWGARASVDSVGYRAVRTFRSVVAGLVTEPLLAGMEKTEPRFSYAHIPQAEGAIWQLATQRPEHLLDAKYASWDALLRDAVDQTIKQLTSEGKTQLGDATWGERNRVRIRHPLSFAVPLAGRWLDMAALPLPGDYDMPRVQTPMFGASQRMAVSPGAEGDGYFHMPGGASGNPASPFYRSEFQAWAKGQPLPFLPAAPRHRLALTP